MSERTLVVSAVNLLVRGFLVVPTDRVSREGAPVNALFAVARALRRILESKPPTRAVAIIEAEPHDAEWPPILKTQLPSLEELLRTHGLSVVTARDEANVVASYARAALEAGEDVFVVGVDKRYAQLVSDRLWWYDANKDVRYTPEIVRKRFGVGPASVADRLALVGDDSGNDPLPGIKGIGAKGATSLLEAHGTVTNALAALGSVEGRVGKALAAAEKDVPIELARAALASPPRPLPLPLDAIRFRAPAPAALNALSERLGFAELLVADASTPKTDAPSRSRVCLAQGDVAEALTALRGTSPIAVHMLLEDPAPIRRPIAGIALANGASDPAYVPFGTDAWGEVTKWLEDASEPKVAHALVDLMVELRRAGVTLAGAVGDSAVASHLTEPSNWAPHELITVAKHVLGRALPEDDAVRGVGKQRKAWAKLPMARVADHAAALAESAGAVWSALSPALASDQLADALAMVELCVRMELTGLIVDPAELDRAEVAFAEIERELQQEIDTLAGHPFNVNSTKQLGDVLFEELKLPVVSHTRTGFSTSIEALERIEHAHPIVSLVLRWRALRRLRDNWVHALRRCIDDDGRVHSRFDPARSFSGQIVNSNPDLGRVPGRTPEMARIRRAFVAAPGHLLMSVDFNQLGLHVLAHLTKDSALCGPLAERADMHRLTAAAILERAPETITTEERQLGKVVNFATFAGQGASALALQLGISAAEAKEYIRKFDRHYAKVRAFQDEQLRLAKEEGGITTIAGRRWPIGGLESLDNQVRSYAERMARRATHEASVQDVSRRALLEADRAITREGLKTKPVLQILDEVLFEVPEAELPVASRVCADAMRSAYALEVPLSVGVEAGPNWADLEPVAPLDALP